jgi:hypothetical protein
MQKLGERNTYTPTDIPHIRSNCGLPLNREETLSVSGLKTSSNNSDAALTGFGSSRTGLSSPCYKNFPLLTENTIAGSLILRLPSRRRGTLLHTLKSVVSVTSAPHGDL